MSKKIDNLRTIITENLRIQRHSEDVEYVDTNNLIGDLKAKQNHVVFARRGCGKTLLLFKSADQTPDNTRVIYLNCEDFKRHSFPDVLLEILESIFVEIRRNLNSWFGKKRALRDIVDKIVKDIEDIKEKPDVSEAEIKETYESGSSKSLNPTASLSKSGLNFGISASNSSTASARVEKAFKEHKFKLRDLDRGLPSYKRGIKDFFALSKNVKFIYIQLDDLYHLDRLHQAFVVDYLHRLCKDLPLFFKIATLRHVSTLYVDRNGQPFGAQERHDYQPVNIDYDFSDFNRTKQRNREILLGFAEKAGMSKSELDNIFKGEGFSRLVMAGGGVPRDVMSLFLEMLTSVQSSDGRIGKDDVRINSRANFERRIEELKQDSQEREQEGLLKGIYLIRQFCLEKKINIFMVSEEELKRNDQMRALIYRLLDYRIIHSCASALTHKSKEGTYHAFAIDIGCYAHLRKLDGRFNEIDVADNDAKEKMRSAPILSEAWLEGELKGLVASDIESELLTEMEL